MGAGEVKVGEMRLFLLYCRAHLEGGLVVWVWVCDEHQVVLGAVLDAEHGAERQLPTPVLQPDLRHLGERGREEA